MSLGLGSLDSSDLGDIVSSDTDDIFKSCTAVGEHLETDSNFWCWELQEDDYTQVFEIALFFLLISLGYYLLTFGIFIWASTSLKGIICPTGIRNQNEDEHNQLPLNNIPEFQWFENGRISFNYTLPIYLLMYILISMIYFVIKIFIVSMESSHYIWTFDDLFYDKDFDDFLDAKVIIMIGIFLINSTFFCFTNLGFLCSTFVIMLESEINKLSQLLLFFWILISLIDAGFSVIICCIYYPMALTILYFVAVGFIVYMTISLICCAISPCVSCVCFRMCVDMMGLMRIRYVENGNAEIQCMTPCVRFLYAFILTIFLIIFVYLSECLALLYIFSFLGGPAKSVFYIDFNSKNDNIIFWLFSITVVIGFVGFLMGLIFSCFRNRELISENDQLNRSIIHERAENLRNVRNRHEDHGSDPFSGPNRGYRMISNDSIDDHIIDDEVIDDNVVI
eukprot:287986_1